MSPCGVMRWFCLLGGLALGASEAGIAAPARGPLRVCPDNPRYFATPDGRAVYLIGSHTWNSLQDMGTTDPPPRFDWAEYLGFLERYGHNFIRLWRVEITGSPKPGAGGKPWFCAPHPWARTGPGVALDGKPKFDLTRFDPVYFRRLRERATSAGKRGIYVAVMLFEGWNLQFAPDAWQRHPFHQANNIQGISADTAGDGKGLGFYTLADPAVTQLQEAYVRQVIRTLRAQDNVLYEISNETPPISTEWQYHMIRYIHHLETDLPRRHPVGMTFQQAGGTNATLFDSPAEWISPGEAGGYRDSPPASDGHKVILSDTDHLWGLGGDTAWAWKSFTRGLNLLYMDPLLEDHPMSPGPERIPLRKSLGDTRRYALRMNLNRARPAGDLASSGYCLVEAGKTYLVYLPSGGPVQVNLAGAQGEMTVEWFQPNTGQAIPGRAVAGGGMRSLTPPFDGEAVLFLRVDGDSP